MSPTSSTKDKSKRLPPPKAAPRLSRPRPPEEELPPAVRGKEEPDLPIRQGLARELIRYREMAGLSQGQVALRMGITEPSVVQFERQHNWYLSTLMSYARAVGTELRLELHLVTPEPDLKRTAAASGRPS